MHNTLTEWCLSQLVDDAELVVSELVTNAVKATGVVESDKTTYITLTGLTCIAVRLATIPTGLVVEVWDRDSTPPKRGDLSDLDDESGRGLFIVDTLSQRWSFYRTQGGGKWVWAELAIPKSPGPLPKRQRSMKVPSQASVAETDVSLIRRVRDGLRSL